MAHRVSPANQTRVFRDPLLAGRSRTRTAASDEGRFVAAVVADFTPKRAVGLKLGPSGTAGLVQFVGPVPVERGGGVLTSTREGPGDASEGEFASGRVDEAGSTRSA